MGRPHPVRQRPAASLSACFRAETALFFAVHSSQSVGGLPRLGRSTLAMGRPHPLRQRPAASLTARVRTRLRRSSAAHSTQSVGGLPPCRRFTLRMGRPHPLWQRLPPPCRLASVGCPRWTARRTPRTAPAVYRGRGVPACGWGARIPCDSGPPPLVDAGWRRRETAAGAARALRTPRTAPVAAAACRRRYVPPCG